MTEEDEIRGIVAKYQNEECQDSEAALNEIIKVLQTEKHVAKVFGKDFFSSLGALTLDREDVSDYMYAYEGVHTRAHPDGWTITARVVSDHYTWVNKFRAEHPHYGHVWGNFEETVYADSEEGFQHFYKHHTPKAWDYADI